MENKAQKELKYVVVKIEDLQEYFNRYPDMAKVFDLILEGVTFLRARKGKYLPNRYIICNQDEPYADKVWQTILEGENDKQKVKQNEI